LFAYPTDLPVA